MSYDPTIDYSQMDLSIDKNLAYWKFSELIKNLITLSSDAPRQIELIKSIHVTGLEGSTQFILYMTTVTVVDDIPHHPIRCDICFTHFTGSV